MGIFGALTTSVAGLRAQSYALENISGNIANSQTTAFKRIDTSFLDLIPDRGTTSQLAGSVSTASRETNTVQGDVQSSSIATYMAINGDGFFAVQKPGSFTDNQPVFDGVDRYTRRGDFTLDKNGYLVNGAGYYLEGIPIDPTTGNVTGSNPQVLRFGSDFLPAQPTTTVTYRANLASYPLTTRHDTSVPGCGYGSVSVDVEALRADRLRHMNRHAGAIEANSDPPALVAEGRIQALARSGDDFVCGHHPPCPTVAYVLPDGIHRSPPKLATLEYVPDPFQRF